MEQSLSKKLKQVFWIHLGGMSFFLIQNEFMFNHRKWHPHVIAMMVLTLIGRYVYHKTKNYNLAATIIFTSGVLTAATLIYAAGAIKAPGVFQFALFPLATGAIFGHRYVKWGILGVMVVMIITLSYGYYHPPEHFIYSYETEKITNTVIFIVVSTLLMNSHTKHIEEKDREIGVQKEEIDNLLRIVIHDIASPISVVDMRLVMLRDKQQLDSENVEKLRRPTKKVMEIINSVKKLKQVADGKLELEKEEVHLGQLLKDIHQQFEENLKVKDLTLDIKSTDIKLLSDPVILGQNIIGNLLTNAIKFSYPGSKIELNATKESSWVTLTVKDYGAGIPSGLMGDIFSSNKATTRPGTSGESGTGFGLPIVKRMVDGFGGDIFVESESEKEGETWTLFTVKLPLGF
jgi:signal transduction histidine kinase